MVKYNVPFRSPFRSSHCQPLMNGLASWVMKLPHFWTV